MQKTALSLAACLLALAAAGAHAQALWKWRDASGQLHVSDKAPPAGTPSKDILSAPPGGVLPPPASLVAKPASAAEAPAASGTAAESALDRKKKAVDQEKAEKEKAERAKIEASNAAIRKDNCARAQSTLRTLQAGGRAARMNDKGEREYLDDAARADETKRAQDAIAANCGPAPASR